MNTYSFRSIIITAARLWLLAATLLLTGTLGASATLLVDLTFDEGAIGTPITSTPNLGALGGTGTGTSYAPGNVTYAAGRLSLIGGSQDRAASFSGTGGSVAFPVPAGAIPATSDWTYSAAVYVGNGNVTFDRLLEPFITMTNGDPAYDLSLSTSSGNPGVVLANSTYGFLNNWHQVTVTSDYDGSANNTRQYARVYLDGVLVGASPFGVRFDYSAGFTLGVGDRAGGLYRPFTGMVDDVALWNTKLNDGEVLALTTVPAFLPGYTAAQLDTLFNLFSAGPGAGETTVVAGTTTQRWTYVSGLTGHSAGQIWNNGQKTFLQLDSFGNGLMLIPEPGIIMLLLAGGGLLTYWRRRS